MENIYVLLHTTPMFSGLPIVCRVDVGPAQRCALDPEFVFRYQLYGESIDAYSRHMTSQIFCECVRAYTVFNFSPLFRR